MTPQEIFDKVVIGLRAQGQKCLLNNNPDRCRYRNKVDVNGKPEPDSLKCAAGLLIEDDEYSLEMEGTPFDRLLSYGNCPSSLVDRLNPHARLIYDLQGVHDFQPIDMWEKSFQNIAVDYNLKYLPKET